MAENIVVKEYLTDAMIDAGERLTRKLLETDLPITAAFWHFDPDVNEWRLLFASPEVSQKGPLSVYRRIHVVCDELAAETEAAPFSMVSILDADAELVRLLRKAVSTNGKVSRIRFSKNVVSGRYIEDALIYLVA